MRITSLLPVVVMKMSASRPHVFQRHHLETVHGRLQRADRVDFGHLDAGAGAAQRRGRALAHIAIAADDGDLAGHHGVGGAADAVDQRFLAAVLVVEFRLGDAVVDVDRREGQQALLLQLVEAVTPVVVSSDTPLIWSRCLVNQPGLAAMRFLICALMTALFLGSGNRDDLFSGFGAGAEQHVERGIAAIVEDHVRAVGELEDCRDSPSAPPASDP
jgi:hypothetical protein